MELVEGETLRAWLRRHTRPDVGSVTRIGTQIARALGAAHAAGIVHRDVKPDNVIVRPDGSVKVLDFGVAKLAPEQQVEDLVTRSPDTMPGTVVGTTEYMAPEQARGLAVDARADVFSLGVVLYEMLAGQAPFRGATMTDTLVAILQHEPPPVRQRRPEAGTGLSSVVARCLEKDPDRRYVTGRHVVVELERLAVTGGMGAAAPPSIAVLPFVNMSTDPENEYFCDGIAEDLIGALTKIEHLHVVARTSSSAVNGRQFDLKEIGRLLNVRTVLEGSVRKAGNRFRVTAQLVNVEDGYQVWAERYDRQLEDVFAIQDEISAAIVTALKGKLLGSEKAALEKRQTDNVEAFQLYLRGRHHWHAWTPEGFERARRISSRRSRVIQATRSRTWGSRIVIWRALPRVSSRTARRCPGPRRSWRAPSRSTTGWPRRGRCSGWRASAGGNAERRTRPLRGRSRSVLDTLTPTRRVRRP
jgi:TolB-like protein